MTPEPIEAPKSPASRWLRPAAGLAAIVAVSAATGWGVASLAAPAAAPDTAEVRAALKLRLPKTPIDAIDCSGLGGLCEVASKSTLFYVDRAAKYLVIGRVYDMEARQDLSAKSMAEPMMTRSRSSPGMAEAAGPAPPCRSGSSTSLRCSAATCLPCTWPPTLAESIRAVFNVNAKALKLLPTTGPRFSVRHWVEEDDRKGSVVFISARYVDMSVCAQLLTLWLDMAMNTLMTTPRTQDLKCWFFIDELGALHRLPALEKGLQTARNFGGAIVLGLHAYPLPYPSACLRF